MALRNFSRLPVFAFTILHISAISLSSHAAGGSDTAAFLDIPVGARPAALGGAYTAQAADAYAPVWNPAGLARVDQIEAAGQHLAYLESLHYEAISAAFPIGREQRQGWGVAAQYLGSGDLASRDKDGALQGDFSAHFAAYSVAYARRVNDHLSLGAAGKAIEAQVDGVGALAGAFDAGALFVLNSRLRGGAAISNVGTSMKFLQEHESLPMNARLGVSAEPWRTISASVEGVYRRSGPLSGHAGVEWRPVPALALRTGYRTDTTKELGALAGFSAGLGIDLWGQEFAYAWRPYGDLGTAQYASLVLRFGKGTKEPRNMVYVPHTKDAGDSGPSQRQMDLEDIVNLIESYEERDRRASVSSGVHR